jgi:hypothetical protein
MPSIHTISRRTLISTGASVLASGASFMMMPRVFASMVGAGAATSVADAHHTNDEMEKCIRICQDCHALCTKMIEHCLTLGGKHAAPDHIRLMIDCAQLCETTAQYLIRGSSLHGRMCGLCAEACRQCGDNCQQLAGNDQMVKQCVELCRSCAGSCERMASHSA